MAKKKIRLTATFVVEWDAYTTATKNAKAHAHVRKYLEGMIRANMIGRGVIPIYIERGWDGAMIEDCASGKNLVVKAKHLK